MRNGSDCADQHGEKDDFDHHVGEPFGLVLPDLRLLPAKIVPTAAHLDHFAADWPPAS